MDTISIPLTVDELEAGRAKLAAKQGIVLTGDSGEVNEHGCDIKYAYDGVNLNLTVVHKPLLVKESWLEAKLRGWFETP